MKQRLTYANVVATIALFLALGGGSYAAVQLSFARGGKLRGCVSQRTGVLRLLATGRSCHHGEQLISWNVQGPRGLTGAAGAPGTPGTPGAKGDPGPPGPATGAAGGDLSGTYPNPIVTRIGGHTPITNATTAGGALTGTFPNPQIGQGQVSSSDLASNAAYCSANTELTTTPSGVCSGATSSIAAVNPSPGVYCLTLPIGSPIGGSVTIDAGSPGFPVAFMSVQTTTVAASCGTGPNLLVSTWNTSGTGATLTNEVWYGFFY